MPKQRTCTEQPLFSIITVCYNNLKGLKATYASIQAQGFNDYEWIVIDGNSKDATKEFLKKTEANWISESDDGIYDAMNKGIAKASGTYSIFMNSGDVFAHDKVLSKIRVSSSYLPDLIYGDALEQAKEGSDKHLFKAAKSHREIHRGLFTHHQAIFYLTHHLKEFEYNKDYSLAADYDLTLRFLKEYPDAYYCAQPICVFEAGGVSQQYEREGRSQQQIIRRKELGYSWIQNKTISFTQGLSSFIKGFMPPVYWWLRTHTVKA